MNNTHPTCAVLALAAIAVLPGCKSLNTVQIAADPVMAGASVRVDVAPSSTPLQTVPVSDYWQPGNPVRTQANARTVQFGPGQPAEQTVSVKGWPGKQVVVIADLPGTHANAPGEADPRRKLLTKQGKTSARVQVTSGGLYVVPQK